MAESLPPCAMSCISSAAANTTCDTTDFVCTCADKVYLSVISACLQKTCTVRETLFTQNVTSVECHIPPQMDQSYLPIMLAFFVLAIIAVGLRIIARTIAEAPMWWDDYTNFLALAVCAAYTFINVSLKNKGLGMDNWAVPQENLNYILLLIVIATPLYVVSRFFIRISILLFYLRIFRTPRARKAILFTIGIIVAQLIGFLFPVIFQCSPVDLAWLRWDREHYGSCIDIAAVVWSGAALGLAIDFWMVVLPLPLIARLQLPMRKRVLVGAMFAVGIIGIGISLARLHLINYFARQQNFTLEVVPLTLWSALELDAGIICASLPHLRVLFRSWTHSRENSRKSKRSGLAGAYYLSSDPQPLELHRAPGVRSGIRTTTTIQQEEDHFTASETHLVDPGNPPWNGEGQSSVQGRAWA
ncbi:hypothetical protein F4777DRAFT_413824 [Nemania sp. FL0916]|nr:hypothetical protein F4777DRAFT_413824 [Nemania sp. FL0916]